MPNDRFEYVKKDEFEARSRAGTSAPFTRRNAPFLRSEFSSALALQFNLQMSNRARAGASPDTTPRSRTDGNVRGDRRREAGIINARHNLKAFELKNERVNCRAATGPRDQRTVRENPRFKFLVRSSPTGLSEKDGG